MTVLPELERAFAEARRRDLASQPVASLRGSRPGMGATMAVLVSVLVVVAVGWALVIGHHSSSQPGHRGVTPGFGAADNVGHRTLMRASGFFAAYAVDGSLYVAEPPGSNRAGFDLLRVDPATGRVLATRQRGDEFDQMLLIDGQLWVTSTSPTRGGITALALLDRRSLATRSVTRIPGVGGGSAGSLAHVGGAVWIGAHGQIDKFSASTGQLISHVPIPRDDGAQVSATSSGAVLLVSIGNDRGLGQVQLRDPVTGRLQARTHPISGVTEPTIGGISGQAAWLSESTGNAGYYFRLKLAARHGHALTPSAEQSTEGRGHVEVAVLDNILWVTELRTTFCADPQSGVIRARVRLGDGAQVLTTDHRDVYYSRDTTSGSLLLRALIDPRCR